VATMSALGVTLEASWSCHPAEITIGRGTAS